MAEKKNTQVERVATMKMMADTANKLKAEKKVTIFLPKTDELQKDEYVAINGRGYQIQRGVNVEVPESVAELLKNSARQDSEALSKRQALQERFNEMK